MFNLLIHELKLRRGGILGWGLGGAAFGLMYLTLYPNFADQMAMFEDLLDLPIYQALGVSTMASFEGYMSSTFLNFMPIILSIYALMAGTGALAGEEDKGTLELLVAMPLKRWQIVTAKGLALLIAAFLMLLIAALGAVGSLFFVKQQLDVELTYASIVALTFQVWPLLAFFMMASLFFGAWLPTRGTAGMAATLLLVVSYFGNNLFDLIESLRDWRLMFPFYYYKITAEDITAGVNLNDALILTGAALVMLLLAVWAFERRNLMTAAWFWQRPRLPKGVAEKE
jgi:ABC-2 type transport system permease protein